MTSGAKFAIAFGSYTAIGLGVAFWTIKRNSRGDPSFSGLSPGEKPARILAECILLWPLAAYKNLAPGAMEKASAAKGGSAGGTIVESATVRGAKEAAQRETDRVNALIAGAQGR